jgi:hypothetical protein
MLDSFRLPFTFDPRPLQADLDGLAPADWIPHFNTRYYEGAWSAAALRSVGGVTGQIYPDPTAQDAFADTPLLARCPHIRAVLEAFACPLQSVRLLKLAAGSVIREHKDLNLSYDDGEVRLHIPVRTNPEVEFYLNGRRLALNEGESWYLNFNLPHRVANRGSTDRVHLVLDCVVNDWLRAAFPAEA